MVPLSTYKNESFGTEKSVLFMEVSSFQWCSYRGAPLYSNIPYLLLQLGMCPCSSLRRQEWPHELGQSIRTSSHCLLCTCRCTCIQTGLVHG